MSSAKQYLVTGCGLCAAATQSTGIKRLASTTAGFRAEYISGITKAGYERSGSEGDIGDRAETCTRSGNPAG